MDLSACDTASAPLPLSVIVVDDQGRRTVLWSRESALDLTTADLAPAVVAAGRVVLVDAHQPAAAIHAARCARDAGIPTVLDIDATGPDQDALLAEIDIIITSAAFLFSSERTFSMTRASSMFNSPDRSPSPTMASNSSSEVTVSRYPFPTN